MSRKRYPQALPLKQASPIGNNELAARRPRKPRDDHLTTSPSSVRAHRYVSIEFNLTAIKHSKPLLHSANTSMRNPQGSATTVGYCSNLPLHCFVVHYQLNLCYCTLGWPITIKLQQALSYTPKFAKFDFKSYFEILRGIRQL